MDVRPTDLSWLSEPPDDFRQQVRSLSGPSPDSRAVARRLAGYRLNGNQLYTLGNAIAKLAPEDADVTRLGVLSNGTADLLLPAVTASSLRHGVWLQAIGTAFDQVATEALNPASETNRARCHFVLLCVDHRGLPLTPTPGEPDRAHATVDAALRYIDSIRQALRSASGSTVIFQTIPQVACSLFGSLERDVPGTLQWLINRYNGELRMRVGKSSDLLLDAAALAETVGLAQWHDQVQWTLGKFPFAHAIVPLYADWVGRLIAAARGKARKCLVLDLDNTLWGGVIGDDGLAGIVLGNGSPAGEAHLNIQQTALALRGRGIVLAVSSKNDDQVARSAFRSHPEMLLKEEHIAVFQANWQDKASNLKAIAETLNIGVDALVLLDDSAAERAQVRESLPAVAVPELPADPVFYAETLLAAGYFEAIGFTAEDRHRAEHYQANAARAELLGATTDLESYLRSLQMQAICGPFDPVGRARITQLINKTNQFNLTTRRYTESEVATFEQLASGLTLQVRLIDRLGDNGIVAVVICIEEDPDWLIDTWLMSCRVLNRKLEQATLHYIVSRAQAAGVRSLIGQYVNTERNDMVKDHYARLGFAPLGVREDGSRWQLEVASYVVAALPMEIVGTAPAPDVQRVFA
jgi:FkbH-like protein